MNEFRKALRESSIIVSDGAMGTLLQQKGMPAGMSPEEFGWRQPQAVKEVHQLYVAAGSQIITTNTFGATHFKLPSSLDVVACNRRMAELAREAAGDRAWVAGGVGPTGHFVRPMGDLEFRDLVKAFAEQIKGLVQGGADFILAETHFDLAEARAAVVAAREVCSLPVGVSMTFDKGTCLTGTDPLTFVDSMQNMGVDVVATNCSAGPAQFVDIVRAMLPRLSTPLLVYPNAGLPVLEGEKTVFTMRPQEFAEQCVKLVELGASLVGGCCGTGPEHIRALAGAVSSMSVSRPAVAPSECMVITSRTISVPVGVDLPTVLIGERINPTGKKQLTAELQEGQFHTALQFAEEQINMGAHVLDVNVGAAMIEESTLLPELVHTLVARHQTPLCLDTSDPEAVRTGLEAYPGAPLVNSISGEEGRMELLGPLCRLYGAPCILLPLEGKHLPVTAKERIAIIDRLVQQALDLGLPKRLLMIDVLALTVSSKSEAARACLETIDYCSRTLGLPTVFGLSNISFGLPARPLLNSTFLSMSMARGLTACIANPSAPLLREALLAGEVLLARDPQAEAFIHSFSTWKPGEGGGTAGGGPVKKAKAKTLEQAVIQGEKDSILDLLDHALQNGARPFDLVNDHLIPAINKVGDRYERRECFLPQLIQSAETMQRAFGRLKPLLEEQAGTESRPVIIMATVEGDIHDIGKNIVILMLRNHGFDVVDLGKNVPAADIVAAARQHRAQLIGLSALMTTTMVRMRDVIEMVREQGLSVKVMIGGAVVTEAFSVSIGADGHALDAVSAVRLAEQLVVRS